MFERLFTIYGLAIFIDSSDTPRSLTCHEKKKNASFDKSQLAIRHREEGIKIIVKLYNNRYYYLYEMCSDLCEILKIRSF